MTKLYTDKAMPPKIECGCGGLIEAFYVDPVFFGEKQVVGTGQWDYNNECRACKQKQFRSEQEREKKEQVQKYLDAAGFDAIHEEMTMDNLDGAGRRAVYGSILGFIHKKFNLYLFGTPGVGKTFPAVALFKQYVAEHCVPGYFCISPELADDLRNSRERRHLAVIDKLTAAGALVLDDLGTENPTAHIIECYYRLIDRFSRRKRGGLIITSNKPPVDLGASLDYKIASRISGMCRVIEVTGHDRRLVKL